MINKQGLRPTRFAVGTEHETNYGGTVTVVEHLGYNRIRVKFAKTGAEVLTSTGALGYGHVADPSHNLLALVGCFAGQPEVEAAVKRKVAELFPDQVTAGVVSA